MARRRRRGSGKRSPAKRPRAAATSSRSTGAAVAPDRIRDRRPDEAPRRRSKIKKPSHRTKPGPRSVAATGPPALWSRRVLVSAALFAFGTTTSLLCLIAELSYHVADPRQALFYGGTALCIGVAMGLWIPRQIIIRRLHGRSLSRSDPEPADNVRNDAYPAGGAAALAGGLFVATGVTLLLLLLGAQTAESARALLTERFILPALLARALLWAPPLAGLIIAGACGTTALVALHGLHRLAAPSQARISRLWLAIVAAVAIAAIVTRWSSGGPGAFLIFLLPVFIAGMMTTLQRWPEPNPSPPSDADIVGSASAHPLFAVVISAAAIGYALVLALADQTAPPLPIELPLLLCGLAAAAGVLVGQWAGRRYGHMRAVIAAGLFALGFVWVLPYHWFGGGDGTRLFVVCGVGVAGIVLATRRVAIMYQSVQYVLSVVGVCIALGLTLAFVSAPLWVDLLPAARIGLLISLGIVAVVGVLLLLDRHLAPRIRRPGIVTVGVWLVILPAVAHGPASASGSVEAANEADTAASAALALGREMLATNAFRTHIIAEAAQNTTSAVPSAWQIDMASGQSDVLIIAPDTTPVQSTRRAARAARRLLKRCARGLRPGGRLVIEQPNNALTPVAFGTLRDSATDAPWNAYLLRVSPVGGNPYSAVLFGNDVPAWIAGRIKPPNAKVALFPVASFAELTALVESNHDNRR